MKNCFARVAVVCLALASSIGAAPKIEMLEEHKFVFFAVLEGLYEDGVGEEALKLIIPDPAGMIIEKEPEKTNFVYACPLCTPAFDAFRLYVGRPDLYGLKIPADTFGDGLSGDVMKELRATPQRRRDAIQGLIQKWVKRKLDRTKLTAAEREKLEGALKEMRKKGEEMLQRFQEEKHGDALEEVYRDWEGCPICAGASPMGGQKAE